MLVYEKSSEAIDCLRYSPDTLNAIIDQLIA